MKAFDLAADFGKYHYISDIANRRMLTNNIKQFTCTCRVFIILSCLLIVINYPIYLI